MNISDVLLSHFVLNILACIIPDDGGGPSKHVGGTKKLCPMYIAHGKIPLCFFLRCTPNLCPSVNLRDQVTHSHNNTTGKFIVLYIL